MQWQYKTANISAATSSGLLKNKLDSSAMDGILNQLGHDRWELVSIFTLSGEVSREVVAILKRPVVDAKAICETRGTCPACGYDLRAATEPMCPECGWSGDEA